MRIAYLQDGTPRPVFEAGDLVRLCHDDIGELVTFRCGEWGRVVRIGGTEIDIQLAGFSRPRNTPVAFARGVPKHWVEPCNGRGLPVALRQRDLDLTRRPGTL
jgi:hypothetical protein